ncbi:MAG: hypothetical protein AAF357_19820, partial [Verrucomicrobiota bacterium]
WDGKHLIEGDIGLKPAGVGFNINLPEAKASAWVKNSWAFRAKTQELYDIWEQGYDAATGNGSEPTSNVTPNGKIEVQADGTSEAIVVAFEELLPHHRYQLLISEDLQTWRAGPVTISDEVGRSWDFLRQTPQSRPSQFFKLDFINPNEP